MGAAFKGRDTHASARRQRIRDDQGSVSTEGVLSNLRLNFLNWRPDQDEWGFDGLIKANNVIHDTEGYKSVKMKTAGAFATGNFYSATPMTSIRSMQVRAVGKNFNKIAAIAEDRATTATMADLSIGAEGEASAFTSVASATLVSAGGVRVASFSIGELESGSFVVCATFDQSMASGGSTTTSITGELTYTITSESEGSPGEGTTSLEGGGANHSQTANNIDVWAGVHLDNDGTEYAYSATGTAQGITLTSWLDSGSADTIWVRATLDSGTLTDDAGTDTWLSLANDRAWAIKRASLGTGTAQVTLETATDSQGTNILESATYTLTAIREGVQLAGTSAEHTRFRELANCVAGVHIDTNGTEYAHSNAGVNQGDALQSWLVGGAASSFYIRCTLNSGTLDDDNSGTGTWLQLNTSRAWSIIRTTQGIDTAQIKLEIADDASGTNILTSAIYNLRAERDNLA